MPIENLPPNYDIIQSLKESNETLAEVIEEWEGLRIGLGRDVIEHIDQQLKGLVEQLKQDLPD